nr:transposase [uncultured Albidiferax sp.]
MLKESEVSRYSTRRTHRTYTPEFKAELVRNCQQPGTSIAALAGEHAMNANVLHRWLKEHQRSGCHQLVKPCMPTIAEAPSPAAAFIALALPPVTPVHKEQEIKVELRKGALSMTMTWPLSAAADLADWTAAILK